MILPGLAARSTTGRALRVVLALLLAWALAPMGASAAHAAPCHEQVAATAPAIPHGHADGGRAALHDHGSHGADVPPTTAFDHARAGGSGNQADHPTGPPADCPACGACALHCGLTALDRTLVVSPTVTGTVQRGLPGPEPDGLSPAPDDPPPRRS